MEYKEKGDFKKTIEGFQVGLTQNVNNSWRGYIIKEPREGDDVVIGTVRLSQDEQKPDLEKRRDETNF